MAAAALAIISPLACHKNMRNEQNWMELIASAVVVDVVVVVFSYWVSFSWLIWNEYENRISIRYTNENAMHPLCVSQWVSEAEAPFLLCLTTREREKKKYVSAADVAMPLFLHPKEEKMKSFFPSFLRAFIILWPFGGGGWFRSFRIFQCVNRAQIRARKVSFFILCDVSGKEGNKKWNS